MEIIRKVLKEIKEDKVLKTSLYFWYCRNPSTNITIPNKIKSSM